MLLKTAVLSEHVKNKFKDYLKEGYRVAEIYNGTREEILTALSEIVGITGTVYGIDKFNPFNNIEHMRNLQSVKNIRLIQSEIPPIPLEAMNLDAIISREFLWTYQHIYEPSHKIPFKLKENPEVYSSINDALKNQGLLLIHLNEVEQEYEQNNNYPVYQNTIHRNLPNFQKIYHVEDLMIYQKLA